MANKTVYPYGQDGQLPSGYPIADDLVTDSAQQALSAKQGKVLSQEKVGFPENGLNRIPVHIQGNNNNLVYGRTFGLLAGRKYRVTILNPNVSVSNITTVGSDYIRFGIAYVTSASETEYLVRVMCDNLSAPLADHYDIEIPDNIELDRVYFECRFNLGETLNMYISEQFVVEDTLNSGSTTTALSANQGRELKFMITGEKVIDASDSAYEHYKDGYQLYATSSVIGLNIDNVQTYAQSGRTNTKIPIAGYKKVKFYEYSSSMGYGSLIIDANGIILAAYTNSTGQFLTVAVPEGAAYLVYSTTSPTGSKITLYGDSVIPNVPTDDSIIASGEIVGAGNTIVDYDIPISKGDYIHIDFPNGNWATASQRDDYYKFLFNLYNIVGNTRTYVDLFGMCRESWTVPAYGYDFYASPRITASYNTLRLRFRASSGTTVPFTVTRLSKEESKPYLADEISDSVMKVKERQTTASMTFGMITDLHYRSLKVSTNCVPPFAPYSPLAAILSMRRFASLVRMDNVVCLGDVIEGRQTAYIGKYDASDILEFFSLVGNPLIYAIGNHDSNRYYSQEEGDRIFTQGEIYANFIQQVDERSSLGGSMNGCNYYRDIERHKVRCIVLMSINFSGAYEYTSATRTWLTNALSSMPEGYKAVVFTHIPPPAAHNWSTEGAPTGGAATATILENNADKIICVFDGHLHVDNVYVKPYISVNMCCQKVYNSTVNGNPVGSAAPEGAWWPVREAGTKNELLWDATVINQEEGLVSCIRVGAGVDRYIHYNPIEVAAGGTTTLTPAVVTATSWAVLNSEASAISIADGVVTVDASATVGSRLMAKAVDANGNFEYWCIKVVAGS